MNVACKFWLARLYECFFKIWLLCKKNGKALQWSCMHGLFILCLLSYCILTFLLGLYTGSVRECSCFTSVIFYAVVYVCTCVGLFVCVHSVCLRSWLTYENVNLISGSLCQLHFLFDIHAGFSKQRTRKYTCILLSLYLFAYFSSLPFSLISLSSVSHLDFCLFPSRIKVLLILL